MVGFKVLLQLITDSKSLFNVISKGSRTLEIRMMLDIAAAREGFRNKVISDIDFVRNSSNIADELTKAMHHRSLRNVLPTGHLDMAPERRIIRN